MQFESLVFILKWDLTFFWLKISLSWYQIIIYWNSILHSIQNCYLRFGWYLHSPYKGASPYVMWPINEIEIDSQENSPKFPLKLIDQFKQINSRLMNLKHAEISTVLVLRICGLNGRWNFREEVWRILNLIKYLFLKNRFYSSYFKLKTSLFQNLSKKFLPEFKFKLSIWEVTKDF